MGAKANLLKYIEKKCISKPEFYKKTGLSNGFLDKNQNISSQNIEIIIYAFPDLDLNWLITGEGEMLRKDAQEKSHTAGINQTQYAENQDKYTKKTTHEQKSTDKPGVDIALVESQKETIEAQKLLIQSLTVQIEMFKKEIQSVAEENKTLKKEIQDADRAKGAIAG